MKQLLSISNPLPGVTLLEIFETTKNRKGATVYPVNYNGSIIFLELIEEGIWDAKEAESDLPVKVIAYLSSLIESLEEPQG
jgi:hypothetical protein